MFEVRLSESAQAVFAAAQASLQRKLDRCFQHLAADPRRHPNIKRLKGELAGYYRYRVGDYRVLYRVDDNTRAMYVAIIAHRREVYG